MAETDLFANDLLEEAKRFLEKAGDSSDPSAKMASLHAALMLSFCALEAHINAIGDDLSTQTSLSVHEKGILLERDVRLKEGDFRISNSSRMSKLEDRIELLYAKFSGTPLDRSMTSWSGRLSERSSTHWMHSTKSSTNGLSLLLAGALHHVSVSERHAVYVIRIEKSWRRERDSNPRYP